MSSVLLRTVRRAAANERSRVTVTRESRRYAGGGNRTDVERPPHFAEQRDARLFSYLPKNVFYPVMVPIVGVIVYNYSQIATREKVFHPLKARLDREVAEGLREPVTYRLYDY